MSDIAEAGPHRNNVDYRFQVRTFQNSVNDAASLCVALEQKIAELPMSCNGIKIQFGTRKMTPLEIMEHIQDLRNVFRSYHQVCAEAMKEIRIGADLNPRNRMVVTQRVHAVRDLRHYLCEAIVEVARLKSTH